MEMQPICIHVHSISYTCTCSTLISTSWNEDTSFVCISTRTRSDQHTWTHSFVPVHGAQIKVIPLCCIVDNSQALTPTHTHTNTHTSLEHRTSQGQVPSILVQYSPLPHLQYHADRSSRWLMFLGRELGDTFSTRYPWQSGWYQNNMLQCQYTYTCTCSSIL